MCNGCSRRLTAGFHEIKQVNESEAVDDEFLHEIRQLPGNAFCADCGAREPTWASISLGTLICLNCAGTHREFGVTVSFVQSLTLDELKSEYRHTLRHGGNERFQEAVLQKLPLGGGGGGEGGVGAEGDGGSTVGGAAGYPHAKIAAMMHRVYHSRAAELYRRQLKARASGEEEPTKVRARVWRSHRVACGV